MPDIQQHTFDSGLTLLAEPMPGVQSAALTFLTPAGNARQPADQLGVANLLAEVIGRGAGGLASREHSDALDMLGVHRSTSAGNRHLRIGAALVGDKLHAALPLLLDQALRPNLDPAELEPSRVIERGAVAPGRLIAVDLAEGGFLRETEMLDQLAANHDFEVASTNRFPPYGRRSLHQILQPHGMPPNE